MAKNEDEFFKALDETGKAFKKMAVEFPLPQEEIGALQIDIVPIDAVLDVYAEKYGEYGQSVQSYEAYFVPDKGVVVFIVMFNEEKENEQ